MNIKISVKSMAKTRNIEFLDYRIKDNLKTLQDLIENLVDLEIDKYEQNNFSGLTQEKLNVMVENGKVSFGFTYREDEKVNREQAKEVALLAFKDGLYLVFIDQVQIEELDEVVEMKPESMVDLIRLTLFTGRYF